MSMRKKRELEKNVEDPEVINVDLENSEAKYYVVNDGTLERT